MDTNPRFWCYDDGFVFDGWYRPPRYMRQNYRYYPRYNPPPNEYPMAARDLRDAELEELREWRRQQQWNSKPLGIGLMPQFYLRDVPFWENENDNSTNRNVQANSQPQTSKSIKVSPPTHSCCLSYMADHCPCKRKAKGFQRQEFSESHNHHHHHTECNSSRQQVLIPASDTKCLISEGHFTVSMNMSQFNAEDISVRTVDNVLVIKARQQTHVEVDHGRGHDFLSKSREFLIPSDVHTNELQSTLSKNGVLTITAPRRQPEVRILQILQEPDTSVGRAHNISINSATVTTPDGGEMPT